MAFEVFKFLLLSSVSAILLTEAATSKTDEELMQFTSDLLKSDTNTARVVYNLQGKQRSRPVQHLDLASVPLFDPLQSDVLKRPSYEKFIKLLDNYDRRVEKQEQVTKEEQNEMKAFLETVLQTSVMKKVKEFLIKKGKVSQNTDFYQLLYKIWFNQYSRASNVQGSSGFEHVFVGEIKHNAVSGLHNWLQFYLLEKSGAVNYQGFFVHLTLERPVVLLKYIFSWDQFAKPTGTMFIGTSPEFEMALYTLCFYMKPNAKCPVRFGQKTLFIQTHTLKQNGELYIGSAYPTL